MCVCLFERGRKVSSCSCCLLLIYCCCFSLWLFTRKQTDTHTGKQTSCSSCAMVVVVVFKHCSKWKGSAFLTVWSIAGCSRRTLLCDALAPPITASAWTLRDRLWKYVEKSFFTTLELFLHSLSSSAVRYLMGMFSRFFSTAWIFFICFTYVMHCLTLCLNLLRFHLFFHSFSLNISFNLFLFHFHIQFPVSN